jgi:hypothetical protein
MNGCPNQQIKQNVLKMNWSTWFRILIALCIYCAEQFIPSRYHHEIQTSVLSQIILSFCPTSNSSLMPRKVEIAEQNHPCIVCQK